MDIVVKKIGIGVIVGRFQVHKLHPGHLDLFNDVLNRHEKVFVFLGESPTKSTRNNPLPFKARKLMILESFPQVSVFEIKDVHHEELWSKTLDEKIREAYPEGPVTFYGSRDGFIPYYRGKFPTVELKARLNVSGSEIRKSISTQVLSDVNFRHGWIAACYDKYPTSYTTVDAAIINESDNSLLLARKINDPDGKWHFIGGFVDINLDKSKEEAVKREAMEETGLKGMGEPLYVGSAKIDDWRYRNEQDGIMTSLFVIRDFVGIPKAADDIAEVKWFDIGKLSEEVFVPEHVVLYNLLKAYLNRTQKNKGEK